MSQKIAIVYDWMDKWGGVERILLTLHSIFPNADFYTSYVDYVNAPWAKKFNIKTSFIQHLPHFIRSNRVFMFLFFPYAFESFDFRNYDVVISITSAFAKSIITRPETTHISYLLTPPRYLWGMEEEYVGQSLQNKITLGIRKRMREFDFITAQRVDRFIAISKTIAERCKKYYRREANIVYPPFDLDYWNSIKMQKPNIQFDQYFLVVSRLEPYKKVKIVVDTFRKLTDKNLVIVGDGSQKTYLKEVSSKNIQFLHNISDKELAYLYENAEALIMPQEEDFGYVSLEAQFFGCPVITYCKGGGIETVQDGKTGVYFYQQTEKGLIEGLDRFHTIAYNVKDIIKNKGREYLKKYSVESFKESLKAVL